MLLADVVRLPPETLYQILAFTCNRESYRLLSISKLALISLVPRVNRAWAQYESERTAYEARRDEIGLGIGQLNKAINRLEGDVVYALNILRAGLTHQLAELSRINREWGDRQRHWEGHPDVTV